MSRQFSIPTVLRMVPNAFLGQFFERLQLGSLDIKWQELGEREIDPILKEIGVLSRAQQDTIEGALRSVFDLACETGIDAIFEAATKCGDLDLPTVMPKEASAYAKAIWTWLNRTEAFEKAVLIHQVDNLSWWRKRRDLPKKPADTSPMALERLGKAISDLLLLEQGRGQACTVEHFSRADGTDYFFAHPDDFVQNVTAHDDDGVLTPRTFRQTFVIVFAFNADDGTLELFARVAPKLKAKIENLFAWAVLDTELGTWTPEAAYELNHLKDRSVELATDPEDRIRVYIRKMRLSFKNSDRRIWLEVEDDHDNIHDMIEECLNQENVSMDEVNITLATFTFEFLTLEGRKPGTLTFDVAWPSSCGLRNQRPERIEVAQKYLKRWKIDGGRALKFDFEAIGEQSADDYEE
jgi:hypothetical protein